jgi:serine/threonine protein phosphatase PrpC
MQVCMQRCPSCHALYPDGDRFCEVDGEVLVVERDKQLSAIPTLPVAMPPPDVPIGPGKKLEPTRMDEPAVVALVREVIAFSRRFEKAGLAWQPQPEDFVVTDAGLGLLSARGVFRRVGPFDVRPALRALGEALLDAPAAAGSLSLVRLLSDPSLPSLAPDEAMAMLESNEQIVAETKASAAVLSHVGYKRPVQQDAVRLHVEDGWTVLTLCDGVSGSIDGGLAARVGSAAACDQATAMMRAAAPRALGDVVRESILTAHRAVCTAAAKPMRPSSRPPGPLPADRTREAPVQSGGSQEPPGSTIVVAAIRGREVAIGWAGDSRAYVAGEAPVLLTHDHSWANAMIATGHVSEEEAFAQPLAHALTRCIGPLDEVGAELVPDVRTETLAQGAVLVLCSYGVWAYLAKPETMSSLVTRTQPPDAGLIARALIHESLLRGGHDNASVAVYVVP